MSMVPARPRVFLLSPANCSGIRAQRLLRPESVQPLASRLQGDGVPLGELFTFLSSLYFRGKLAYARRFAQAAARPDQRRPAGAPEGRQAGRVETATGVWIITPSLGLQPPDGTITARQVREFAKVDVSLGNTRYRAPFDESARLLMRALDSATDVVLLGSIATDKYVGVLGPLFGDRLVFPAAFVGRGDMSRGGLLLRAADAGEELDYVPVAGAVRCGPRPPKLAPLPRSRAR